ncbi:hypothetical protein QUF76_03290 [Desulfobacterales bacterium HSG16]|nr:hypothetical protein [Desulfobacterales bacterium HSG16]
MGFEDSAILLFFAVFIALIVHIWKEASKGSAKPQVDRSSSQQTPPDQQRSAGPVDIPAPVETSAPLPVAVPSPAASPITAQVSAASENLRAERIYGDSKGIFVVVTSPEPEIQLMAMSLSTQIMGKGKSVRIMLCGAAGELAVRGSKEVMLKPLDKSPQMLMKNLMNSGVVVEICPFYLPNRGLSPADLVVGINVAKPPVIAEGLIEPGVKLFTF